MLGIDLFGHEFVMPALAPAEPPRKPRKFKPKPKTSAAQLDLFEQALEALKGQMLLSFDMPDFVSDCRGVTPAAEEEGEAIEATPEIPYVSWGKPWFADRSGMVWSGEALVYLAQRLLWRSLEELALTDNEHDKWSCLKWIFKPALRKEYVYDKKLGRSQVFTVHENDEPFSFHNCCLLTGMDEDEIRQGVRRVLPAVVVEAVEQVCKY